jgi:hypothetical protein
MALVRLHMVVHGILILLGGLTDATYKLSRGVLLVGICHGLSFKPCQRLYQFFKALRLWPSLFTVAIVAATAVGLLRKALLLRATPPVILLGRGRLVARLWIYIHGAELLSTLPAPGAAAALADLEAAPCFEPACEDIVACGIL